ncbi:MAG: hypothetical protein QXH37_02085 [Candidatus Bathyarchaeia archaeon]
MEKRKQKKRFLEALLGKKKADEAELAQLLEVKLNEVLIRLSRLELQDFQREMKVQKQISRRKSWKSYVV